jgi:hypothetical protein
MNCRVCDLELKEGDRFVLVGFYPRKLKKMGYHDLFDGPEYFGDLYHENCYLKSFGNHESSKKEGVEV